MNCSARGEGHGNLFLQPDRVATYSVSLYKVAGHARSGAMDPAGCTSGGVSPLACQVPHYCIL